MADKNQFPIPFLIFQALQSSLLAEAKRLTKDISATLNKPEGPLWKEIQKDLHSMYLIEQTEPTYEEFQCKAHHIKNGVWTLCRDVVVYGSKYCPRHYVNPCEHPPADLPVYKCIELEDNKLGFLNDRNEVLDTETLEKIGVYIPKKNIVKIFRIL